MDQAAAGDIRLEPCRMPLGPKRAPGRAVTPYQLLIFTKATHPMLVLEVLSISGI